jgi:hypothetical protein
VSQEGVDLRDPAANERYEADHPEDALRRRDFLARTAALAGGASLAGLLSQLGVSPSQLGGLGSLGVPGSGILGKGTPSSPPSGTPSGASSGAAQKYLQCVAKAGSAADLQKCQSLAP